MSIERGSWAETTILPVFWLHSLVRVAGQAGETHQSVEGWAQCPNRRQREREAITPRVSRRVPIPSRAPQ